MRKSVIVFFVLILMASIMGCMNSLSQLPDTPYGQAALLIGGYHDQVIIYQSEVKWAENPDHIRMLKGRLEAFKLADASFNEIGMVVAAGGSIPEGLLRSTKNSLSELKRWLYTKQGISRTKPEIEAALVRAHIIPEYRSQGWESIVLLLIELVQSFSPMWDRLDLMSGMTPEQIIAEFNSQWLWKQGFDPYQLPIPIEG